MTGMCAGKDKSVSRDKVLFAMTTTFNDLGEYDEMGILSGN